MVVIVVVVTTMDINMVVGVEVRFIGVRVDVVIDT